MRKATWSAVMLGTMLTVNAAPAAEPDKDGFSPLFNGKDLSGWVNVNCHPGTFYVKDGEIVTTGKPTGFLRTAKHYENFILELEWMHTNKKAMGNSGLFIWGDPLPAVGTPYTRGIEVQVLVNFETDWATSHGDVFSIWGAKCKPDRPHPKGYERCLPSERRCKGGGEWNHYRIEGKDGAIKLHVNGKEVSGVTECNPRKGYLALESEGAECRFRNIRIKELPTSNPPANMVAEGAKGHRLLYNGLDLDGWKAEKADWQVGGGILRSNGKGVAEFAAPQQNYELVFDWKFPAKAADATPTLSWGGRAITMGAAPKPGSWTRSVVTFSGGAIAVTTGGKPQAKAELENTKATTAVRFDGKEGLELMNLFLRELAPGK